MSPALLPLVLPLLAAAPARAGANTALVGFTDAQARDGLRAWTTARGGEVRACYDRAAFCVLDFPAPPPLAELGALPGVRYAEADAAIEQPHGPQQALPGDAAGTADCPDLWELPFLGAEEAWTVADGTDGPVVAVADGGFLTSHEELAGRISGQWDYGDGDPVANLEWDVGVPAHGTFIAAIVAGVPDNGAGRAGLAPRARVNLLKIADSSGAFYWSYAASALADVADGDLGIRAVNYSIASSGDNSAFRDAVRALAALDVVVVAAAGNCSSAHCSDADNDDHPLYPANYAYDHVITVAGATRDGGFNSYSHYGRTTVDLAAPGVDICSAGVTSDDDYYSAAGTSYAAPLVAATISLLLEAHPDLSPLELGRVLRASAADHPDWADRVQSGGVLDVAAALATAVPRLDPPGDVAVDGTATLGLQVENPGADGTGTVVLAHGPGLEVLAAPAGWSAEPYGPGHAVDLPDAGLVTMAGTGTVLTGPLDAHAVETLAVELAGRELGTHELTVRLVVESDGADYLNAPYDDGMADETGFLAWSLSARVDGVAAGDTGPGGGGDSGDPGAGDSGDPGAGDSGDGGVPGDGGGPDSGRPPLDDQEAPKGGCALVASPAGLLPALFLPLVGLLRRRR